MSTPEQIVDGTQAENSVSGDLARVVNRLRKLPSKAGREGDNSPSVWVTFGECVREIESLTGQVAELEHIVRSVFSPDPAA